jgi:hypothetical protein
MKPSALMAGAVVMFSLLVVQPLHAQGGKGRAGAGGRLYDPKTVETVTGDVVRVDQVSRQGGQGRGGGHGVHVLLKTDQGDIPVHLGPSWYMEKQALQVAPNDKIEVRGSRVTVDGKPAIIAAEVKKGDQVLKLRDDNGVPLWSRQGRRAS